MIYYGLILYTIYYYVHSYVGVFAVHSYVFLTEKKVKVPSLTWTILRHCFEIDIILMGHTVFPSVFLFFKANLPAHSLYCAESLLPATRTLPDAFLPSQTFVPASIIVIAWVKTLNIIHLPINSLNTWKRKCSL